MPDISKTVKSPDEILYESFSRLAEEWMMDNYDDYKITVSSEEAKEFEERATKAGLTIEPFP